MLIHDYLDQQIEYEKKYGTNTLVLMQVGSFFEFYGVDNDQEKIGNAKIIAEILNIQLTRRNKSILENSRNNCLMAGFPTHSLKRFIQILLSHQYTIVLIEQVTPPPNPKRDITQIFSPGTYIEEVTNYNPNNIVSLYLNHEICFKTNKNIYLFGLATIDLSTGKNYLYEAKINYYDKNAYFEEIYRFIETFNPKEIIINYSGHFEDSTNDILNELNQKINLQNRLVHYKKIDIQFENIHYQNKFLSNIFKYDSFLNPLEYLDLEKRKMSTISYIILLEFAFEHNENSIQKIDKPQFWNYDDHLILYHNALYQLNIVSLNNQENHKYKSLFHVIDKTSTSLGKRFLKYCIHNPLTNSDLIQKRYSLIEEFINIKGVEKSEKLLDEIIDIERIHRKISLGQLHPFEFLNLSYTYLNIQKLIDIFINVLDLEDYYFNEELICDFENYIVGFEDMLNLQEMGKYNLQNIQSSFFKKGVYQELDDLQQKIDNVYSYFHETMKELSNIIEKNSDFVKMEHNDRDGYFIYTTKKRSEILVKELKKQNNTEFEIKRYTTTNVKIYCDRLNSYSHALVKYEDKMKELTKQKYLDFLKSIYQKHHVLFHALSQFIIQLDFIKCGAKVALTHHYTKPTIMNKYNQKSYFEASEMRHPIIELIHENYEYISNDISMDHDKNNGFLLYGINGVGKSSLSKAVGCNIILAQMGFYVPCSSFSYYPYSKIFTRINGDDNIFKGMSSFVVEMDELRSILKYSDSQSIVLGDEICKGTEETSALAIVSASILRFCQNNVQFIMATHFHKLVELDEIKKLDCIHFKHLSIEYKNGKLIYGRKLMDGCGSNLYGVEIANYIIDDQDFIKDAKNIRNKLTHESGEILENKTSNYNSKLYVEKCSICGKVEENLDTHHIIEQHDFDDINKFKNKLSNLVVLCKEHHHEVHHGLLKIHGYKESVQGKILDFEYIKPEIKKGKRKYGDDQIKLIKNMFNEMKDHQHQMKITLLELKKKNINISSQTLRKIVNETY